MKTIDRKPFPYLSISQAMEVLDVSRGTITNLIKQGKITPRYLNTKPYISVDDLIQAIESSN